MSYAYTRSRYLLLFDAVLLRCQTGSLLEKRQKRIAISTQNSRLQWELGRKFRTGCRPRPITSKRYVLKSEKAACIMCSLSKTYAVPWSHSSHLPLEGRSQARPSKLTFPESDTRRAQIAWARCPADPNLEESEFARHDFMRLGISAVLSRKCIPRDGLWLLALSRRSPKTLSIKVP